MGGNTIKYEEGEGRRDNAYGLGNNDDALVHRTDFADELVCPTRECQRCPIVALRLPVRIEAHNGDDQVGLCSDCDCVSDEGVGVLHWGASKTDTGVA